MEIEVFKPINNNYEYESIDIIDTFNHLQTIERFKSYNDFELKVALNRKYIENLRPETILLIDDVFYFIDDVDGQDYDLMIQGKSLVAKSKGRIIDTNYNRQARPEIIGYDLLNHFVVNPTADGLKVKFLSLSNVLNLGTPSIRYQNSYGEVMESIEELCTTYGYGFIESPSGIYNPSSRIEFVAVDDVSDVVEFSVENENLLGESYKNNNFDEANVAIVLGEGEGSERRRVVVNNHIVGLERKEIYVDARDIQSEVDDVQLSNAEYDQLLRERGIAKLAERNKVLALESEINTRDQLFIYGEDYGLGSRVSVKSSKYQLKYKAVIESVTKTWDSTGHYIEPQFGDRTPNVLEMLKRS